MNRVRVLVLLLAPLLLLACSEDSGDDEGNGPTGPVDGDEGMPVTNVAVQLNPPPGVPISAGDVNVITGAGEQDLTGPTSYIDVVDGDDPQMIAAVTSSGDPVLLSWSEASGEIDLSVESTCLALAMMNPVALVAPAADRNQLATMIRSHGSFPQLVDTVEEAMIDDPEGYLDAGSDVYVAVADFLVNLFREGSGAAFVQGVKDSYRDVSDGRVPSYSDLSGQNVQLTNPFYCPYGVGLVPYGGEEFSTAARIPARELLAVDFTTWPPAVNFNEDGEAVVSMADGDHSIVFSKGFDFERFSISDNLSLYHPAGIGTLSNATQATLNIVSLLLGWTPLGETLSGTIFTETSALVSIGDSIYDRDPAGALLGIVELIIDNAENIMHEMFQSASNPDNIVQLHRTLGPILRQVSIAFRVIGAVSQAPYWYDLASPPWYVQFNVSSQNGILSELEQPFTVTVTEPFDDHIAARYVSIVGFAEGASASEIYLFNRGETYEASVNGNSFIQTILLYSGENVVEVLAISDDDRIATAERTLYGEFGAAAIRVQLTWDMNQTDVDLWVTEPSGEKVYFANPVSDAGGVLDVDDVDGYGPENYTIQSPPEGEYLVQVHYYSDHGQGPSNARISIFVEEVQVAEFGPQHLDDDEVWTVATILMPDGVVIPEGEIDTRPIADLPDKHTAEP